MSSNTMLSNGREGRRDPFTDPPGWLGRTGLARLLFQGLMVAICLNAPLFGIVLIERRIENLVASSALYYGGGPLVLAIGIVVRRRYSRTIGSLLVVGGSLPLLVAVVITVFVLAVR